MRAGGKVGMIWVFCKQCKRWHKVYLTTVMRCPYCGTDVTNEILGKLTPNYVNEIKLIIIKGNN